MCLSQTKIQSSFQNCTNLKLPTNTQQTTIQSVATFRAPNAQMYLTWNAFHVFFFFFFPSIIIQFFPPFSRSLRKVLWTSHTSHTTQETLERFPECPRRSGADICFCNWFIASCDLSAKFLTVVSKLLNARALLIVPSKHQVPAFL